MNIEDRELWFRAKRYGWGWTPSMWKGWLVFAAYVAFLAVVAALCARHMLTQPAFFACVALLTTLLLAICWLKGEKPQWHWGRK
jgi:hypothetical protein